MEVLTPIKAMRAKCLDCCAGSAKEVRLCGIKTCPLYAYRLGKSPNRKPMSEEQRQKAAERLARAREKRAAE